MSWSRLQVQIEHTQSKRPLLRVPKLSLVIGSFGFENRRQNYLFKAFRIFVRIANCFGHCTIMDDSEY